MKSHPHQLSIDFTIPAGESLTVPEIARAMNLSTSKIHEAIAEGRLDAVDMSADTAGREEFRVPRNNFYCWLNNEFPERLLYRFPRREWLDVPRIASFFGMSEAWVHLRIADGEFPNAINLGAKGKRKQWRIPLMDLIDFAHRRYAKAIC